MRRRTILSIAVLIAAALPPSVHAQAKSKRSDKPKPVIDANAMRILRSMSDFLGGLKQFSVNVVNMREGLTRTGHRVDFEVASQVIVSRPNKVKAVRQGHLVDQEIFYNGRSLVIDNPAKRIYSVVDAPNSLDATLKFAREVMGIGFPSADLLYTNTFPLLTKDVVSASVIGKEMIAGHRCDHLLFTLRGVDFQIWIPDRGDPVPFKYIVTDTSTPQLSSIVARFSSWNLAPALEEADFTFTPSKDSREIQFRTADGKTLPGKLH